MKNIYEFDFERLEVYRMGIKFVRSIYGVIGGLPRNYSFSLGDQLRRASLSIVNNIAEGSGKLSKKEKSQFYRISLTSARECIPMLTLLKEENIIVEGIHDELRDKCIHICNMLGRLVRALHITPYTLHKTRSLS